MKHSTKPPTLAEQQRFEAIKQVGCVCCWLDGREFVPCTIQHVVEGRKRLGHLYTYGACVWHHLGQCMGNLNTKQCEREIGPSLARSPKAYHAKYGSEHELVDLCNKMIEPYLIEWRSGYS